ncbi:MAG TPA: hypothetical protein VEO95_00995, partial [Chthoniobacteraceae bacterium]|nr:hypothetical protein [Chthoniobacteraceae bacterium]
MNFLAMADDVIVVSTPNLAATLDAYGVVKVIRETRLAARVHLLVNHADGAAQAEGVLGRISTCARQFLQFEPANLGFLPRDSAIETSGQNRTPLVLAAPEHESARRFSALARQLLDARPATEEPAPPCSAAA